MLELVRRLLDVRTVTTTRQILRPVEHEHRFREWLVIRDAKTGLLSKSVILWRTSLQFNWRMTTLVRIQSWTRRTIKKKETEEKEQRMSSAYWSLVQLLKSRNILTALKEMDKEQSIITACKMRVPRSIIKPLKHFWHVRTTWNFLFACSELLQSFCPATSAM